MADGLRITRTFDVPPERVWEAWTDPDQFAEWWGTDAVWVPTETVSLDVREGGEWRAVMHLPEQAGTIAWVGEYTVVEPPHRLAFTLSDDEPDPRRDTVTVDLRAVDGGTEMTVSQLGGGLSSVGYDEAAAGYQGFFDTMATLFG